MKDEFDVQISKGNPPKNRHELESGKKYLAELNLLKENLRSWIEKGR